MATKPKKGLGRGLEALLEAANGKTTLFKPSELNNLEPSIDLADGILQQLSIVQIQQVNINLEKFSVKMN
jgi:hypothetical protein